MRTDAVSVSLLLFLLVGVGGLFDNGYDDKGDDEEIRDENGETPTVGGPVGVRKLQVQSAPEASQLTHVRHVKSEDGEPDDEDGKGDELHEHRKEVGRGRRSSRSHPWTVFSRFWLGHVQMDLQDECKKGHKGYKGVNQGGQATFHPLINKNNINACIVAYLNHLVYDNYRQVGDEQVQGFTTPGTVASLTKGVPFPLYSEGPVVSTRPHDLLSDTKFGERVK